MRTRDIERFAKLLEEQRAKLLKNLEETAKGVESYCVGGVCDEADFAAISADTHVDNAIGEKLHKELREIEVALNKIAQGTYGECEMCTEEIGLERLRAKPHAKFCIDCREIYEKDRENNRK